MAPLAWVEGRPVYRDDVLYGKGIVANYRYDVIGISKEGWIISSENETYSDREDIKNLTWQKPKTKREGWVNMVSVRFDSKEDAERYKQHGQVTAFATWEE